MLYGVTAKALGLILVMTLFLLMEKVNSQLLLAPMEGQNHSGFQRHLGFLWYTTLQVGAKLRLMIMGSPLNVPRIIIRIQEMELLFSEKRALHNH